MNHHINPSHINTSWYHESSYQSESPVFRACNRSELVRFYFQTRSQLRSTLSTSAAENKFQSCFNVFVAVQMSCVS